MSKFKDYTDLCGQMQMPVALKERVLDSYRYGGEKAEKARRIPCRSHKLKAALVAALLLAFLVAACTLAVSSGLAEHFNLSHLTDMDTLNALRSENSESGYAQDTGCLAVARDEWAEYRVLEAICDYNSIYIHFQAVPLDKSTMFIFQTLTPDSPAWALKIPGVSEGTVEEYAKSQGKTLRYANIQLSQVDCIFSDFGVEAETAQDGSLHFYGTCTNFSDKEEFPVVCTAFTYPVEQQTIIPADDRTEFKLILQNNSSMECMVFTSFDPEIQEKFGITIESLAFEKTELGYYCVFTYRGEKAEKTLFSMVDENGQYFLSGGPRGSSSNSLNSDGSYCYTHGIPEVENPEELMFMLVDENFDKHGPYKFQP